MSWSVTSLLGSSVSAAVGCGMVAGLLFTWSNAVIPGMNRAGPEAAAPVMVAANAVISNVWFGLVFAGTPVVLVASTILAFVHGRSASGALLGLAALLYVVGVIAVTAAVHLPLNDALAAAVADPAKAWSDFAGRWQRWNLVRMWSALAACVCAVVAIGVVR